MTDPTPEELDNMARDLCHTGELSMLYRCEISDAITALRAREALIEAAAIDRAAQQSFQSIHQAINDHGFDGINAEGDFSEAVRSGQRKFMDGMRLAALRGRNAILTLAKPGARTLLDQRIAAAEHAGYERGLREAQAKKGDTQ